MFSTDNLFYDVVPCVLVMCHLVWYPPAFSAYTPTNDQLADTLLLSVILVMGGCLFPNWWPLPALLYVVVYAWSWRNELHRDCARMGEWKARRVRLSKKAE